MNNLVFNQNGAALTNSLLVAEKFGKQHKHVIDSIKSFISSAENSAQYFIPSIYTDNSGKSNPMYIMNRDGFTLLAMGFTGKKALEFKLQYIEAFNKMEAELKQIASAPQFNIPTTLSGALRLAAEQAEVIETQQKQIADRPKMSS